MSVLWLKSGYTVKYSLSPREIPRAPPKGFPSGSGYISPYIPPFVIIQIQYTGCMNTWRRKKYLQLWTQYEANPPDYFFLFCLGPCRNFSNYLCAILLFLFYTNYYFFCFVRWQLSSGLTKCGLEGWSVHLWFCLNTLHYTILHYNTIHWQWHL